MFHLLKNVQLKKIQKDNFSANEKYLLQYLAGLTEEH